ncbi:hypothetical protein TorRG33x02_124560 [Trema orientale]|uniref:Uncharacterized protein n=1 Tax=Trema orientale TaxID=63057 RepID=A0A2P5F253_TREOI|nr:hypothetical protein TorRG33x02_124560 [Trema orientale]
MGSDKTFVDLFTFSHTFPKHAISNTSKRDFQKFNQKSTGIVPILLISLKLILVEDASCCAEVRWVPVLPAKPRLVAVGVQ